MASVSVSENDFVVLADAANAALRRGDRIAAEALDKLARKTSAALTNSCTPKRNVVYGKGATSFTWTQVPSVLMQQIRKGEQQ